MSKRDHEPDAGIGRGSTDNRRRGRGRSGPPDRSPGGHRGQRGRGRRNAARGDIRLAVLTLLDEQPMHGYQLMGEIGDRSNGAWTPSPGSIYPLLQQLTDEGLVTPSADGDRKVFTLTDAGRVAATEASGSDIWDQQSPERFGPDLKQSISGVAAAVTQVVRNGTPEQVEKADAVLTDARKQLYRLLAED